MPTVSYAAAALAALLALKPAEQERIRRGIRHLAAFPRLGRGSTGTHAALRTIWIGRRRITHLHESKDNSVRALSIRPWPSRRGGGI
ncbi:MAG: hypothetical protein JF888_11715 [Candidatus Dormibacteraeota bacterium]|uniref:Uncharacterized protein n=1 Tax=Candidatus Dormiibacter inghamiae TaxID=3127013 RepID=A0A934NE38_9BACT|nr:hypothetical protein [Candidatus Dormibacteraeota bacterium]MBJ7606315.1 hypothetical protein [Candidatus Dormibacteraeota bacterium]